MEKAAAEGTSQTSSLSPAVKKLICETGTGFDSVDDLYSGLPGSRSSEITKGISFFTSNYFLNIDGFDKYLFETIKELPWTSDEYVKAVIRLSPVIKECQDLQEAIQPDEFSEKYKEHFEWTKNVPLFLNAFQLLILNEGDKDLLALLITCGGIEHALGNIYLYHLKGCQCPALLKDLLMTDELREILGESAIKILHILLGPPISLNLRNAAWHGFFSVGELPKRYVYFLLVLTASLNQILLSKGIHYSYITDRPYFSLSKADVIAKKLSGFNTSDSLEEIERCILNSWFADSSNRSLIQSIFNLSRDKKYGFSCVQALPVLEHILRKLFVSVNKCPERLLTAEATTLYTTFEEILNYCLPDGTENGLIYTLGEPFLDLLHDLLVYPNGPRSRDKLGHGEADYYSVPQSVLFLILTSMAYIAIKAKNPNTCNRILVDLVTSVQSYESLFHPLTMLKAEIIKLSQTTFSLYGNINTSPDLMPWDLKSDFHMFVDGNGNTSYKEISHYVAAFLENTRGSLSQHVDFDELMSRMRVPFSTVDDFVVTILNFKRISTLHRWQKMTKLSTPGVTESEIVTLMLKVISEATTSLSQSQETLLVRQQQFQQKSLRSRQRENFRKLLYFVPTLNLMMNYVSILLVFMFYFLESHSQIDSKCSYMIQRFLKNTLQVTENLRTFTANDKNKWTQSEEIILNTVQCGIKFTKQLQAASL